MTDQLFRELYKKLELIDDNGHLLSLHTNCPNCDICWKTAKNRMPKPTDNFWTITKPWVGDKYQTKRILIVGENMNEYGGYEGAVDLTNWAREQIENGAIKTFKSKTYSGSFVFHRMASYATTILYHKKILVSKYNNIWPNQKDVSKAFEYIAFTNQIKCSPIGQKSEQTSEMWEKCGKFILKGEIRILEPEIIIILGTSDNFNNFNLRVMDSPISLKWNGKIGFGIGELNNKNTEIYVVPHPASFGGNSKEIILDLKEHLKTGANSA